MATVALELGAIGKAHATPAGTTQATATPLQQDYAYFPSVPSGSGIIIKPSSIGDTFFIENADPVNALNIYPPVGGSINGGAINAPISLTGGSTTTISCFSYLTFGAVMGGSSSLVAIANGGTGQTTANAGFNALSPMTAAGDLIIGGVAGIGTRLPAGLTRQVLGMSDTGQLGWESISEAAWSGNYNDLLNAPTVNPKGLLGKAYVTSDRTPTGTAQDLTLATTDAGKLLYQPSTDIAPRTITLPAGGFNFSETDTVAFSAYGGGLVFVPDTSCYLNLLDGTGAVYAVTASPNTAGFARYLGSNAWEVSGTGLLGSLTPPAWHTVFSQTYASENDSSGNTNIAYVLKTAAFSAQNGNKIRLTLSTDAVKAAHIASLYIYRRYGSSGASAATQPVQITAGGATSFTVPIGSTLVSDPIAFSFDATKDYVISFFIATSSHWSQDTNANAEFYYLPSETNVSGAMDKSTWSSAGGYSGLVSKFEVYQ